MDSFRCRDGPHWGQLSDLLHRLAEEVDQVSRSRCCLFIVVLCPHRDRRQILHRRRIRIDKENRRDPFLGRHGKENPVIVPLPKFALSKSNKTDQLNDAPIAAVPPVNIELPDVHKDGLRNFSYKLSMSGEYEHIYVRDHFQKTNKA